MYCRKKDTHIENKKIYIFEKKIFVKNGQLLRKKFSAFSIICLRFLTKKHL